MPTPAWCTGSATSPCAPAAAVERLTFGNVLGTHGEINNEDRDRSRYTFGGLLRYEANPESAPVCPGHG